MAYYGIFTAANPKDDLGFLKQEFQNLNKYLDPQADVLRSIINVNATDEAIYSTFLSNLDIRIFHFSGHAGDANLLMDDGRLSNLNIITNMIRDSRMLKLVFLNGCATHELVYKFLDKGASLVIATQAPVFDGVACNFSGFFYEGLCREKMNVGQAFIYAREKTKETIKARSKEIEQKVKEDKVYADYENALVAFAADDKPRTIGKAYKETKEALQWSIYFNENISADEKATALGWRLRDVPGGNQSMPIRHGEPGFDFLKSLADAAISIKGAISPGNERLKFFNSIEDRNDQVRSWVNESTIDLIQAISKVLLLPLQAPYNNLINFCNTRDSTLDLQSDAQLKDLLRFQMDLYGYFVKTAAAIMISDFTETLIRIDTTEDNKELKKHFSKSICENASLKQNLEALIRGEKTFDDVSFTINLMRGIVACLSAASAGASVETQKIFAQFIKEYNGNLGGSNLDIALVNSMHEVLIEIKKKFDNNMIDQADVKTLRAYCDRAETALIELFQHHKYVLMYEMVTAIKSEAIRQRIKSSRTINHELITSLGLYTPTEIKYGEEFAETFCVMLISDRVNYVKYLSLSPFIINVAPFVQQVQSILYYFIAKNGENVNYVELQNPANERIRADREKNEESDPLRINVETKSLDFVKLNKSIDNRFKQNDPRKDKIIMHLGNIREQYNYWETKTLELINCTWDTNGN